MIFLLQDTFYGQKNLVCKLFVGHKQTTYLPFVKRIIIDPPHQVVMFLLQHTFYGPKSFIRKLFVGHKQTTCSYLALYVNPLAHKKQTKTKLNPFKSKNIQPWFNCPGSDFPLLCFGFCMAYNNATEITNTDLVLL